MSAGTARYPLGTVKLYGPTDKQATKLVASVYPTQSGVPSATRKWTLSSGDIRDDQLVRKELACFLKENEVAHAVVTEEVIGCPHDEGIDFPAGGNCPICAFWATHPKTRRDLPIKHTPGRNDPCNCGSGKKFKKCCGANL